MLINKKRIPIVRIIFFGFLPNRIKILYLRLKGNRIGKNVKFGFASIIDAGNVEIGDNVTIGFGTIIRGNDIIIKSFTTIGSLVYIDVRSIRIGEDVTIRENVLIGGNPTHESGFEIGDRSHVGLSSIINTSRPVVIGDETAIGGGTKIFTHGSWQSMLDGYPCTYAPVTIGNNVWVNWDVFILPGVTIEDGAMVSVGSIVTQKVPAKSLVSGNPAKVTIPSGKYPRATDPSEKKDIIRYILHQFVEYLKSNSMEVQTRVLEHGEMIRIISNSKKHEIYYYRSTADLAPGSIDGNSVVLLFEHLSDEITSKLLANNVMVLRFDNMTRYGSNAVGEETADFLLKYGMKFKRYESIISSY